jgi:hypothetical protein
MVDMTTVLYLTATDIMIVTDVLVTRMCIRHKDLDDIVKCPVSVQNMCQFNNTTSSQNFNLNL